MGARWNWEAICKNGHEYGNFSGGADDCYECGAEPLVVFDGDDARQMRDRWKARCKNTQDGIQCDYPNAHEGKHIGTRFVPQQVMW